MNKHNAVSFSIIGLLFILLFTPAIVSPDLFFPYITGKAFAFRAIITVIVSLYLILVIQKPHFLPHKSIILCSGALLLTWMVISNIFGADPSNSFLSNFERMEGWVTHAYLFAFLIVISSLIQSEKMWNWFFGTSLVVAQYVALAGLGGDKERIDAVLGNSTYVAIYMLFNVFFAILLLYRLYNSNIKEAVFKYAGYLYYVYTIIFFLYIIFRTQTRGTVLALVISTALFCLLTLISYWKHKIVRTVSLIGILLLIIGSVLFWQNRDAEFIQSNPVLDRITTISASEGTGRSRILTWSIGLQGIAERPIMGWGQENYSYVFAQKYNPEMYDKEPWFDRTHNVFLDWVVHHGIVGFALYIFFILTCIYAVYVSTSFTRVEKNLIYSVIVAYCVHNIFVFDSYSSYLLFFSIVGFIIFHTKKDRIKISWTNQTQVILATSIGLIVLIASYFTFIRPYIVAGDLLDSMRTDQANEIVNIYESILEKNSLGTYESTIRYMSFAPSMISISDVDFVNNYITKTTQAGEMLVTKKPNDVKFLEVYGTFLIQIGNVDRAIEVLTQARSLAPNRQNNLYALGFAYVQNKEYEKAKEVFEHAYNIFPSNERARHYYGATLLLTGDKSGNEYIEGYSYKDNFFLKVFGAIKQYGEVVKIREQLVVDNPEDYQAHVSLAVAYVLNNQRTKAIETIQFVQSKVPEFKAQGDQLIRDIRAGKMIGM